MTIRVAVVNDYEVVVHGVAAMLRSYTDRIEVVELDADASSPRPRWTSPSTTPSPSPRATRRR